MGSVEPHRTEVRFPLGTFKKSLWGKGGGGWGKRKGLNQSLVGILPSSRDQFLSDPTQFVDHRVKIRVRYDVKVTPLRRFTVDEVLRKRQWSGVFYMRKGVSHDTKVEHIKCSVT